jgi:hypothetical protein
MASEIKSVSSKLDKLLIPFIENTYKLILEYFDVDLEDAPIRVWAEKSVPAIKKLIQEKLLDNKEAVQVAQKCALFLQQEKKNDDEEDEWSINDAIGQVDQDFKLLGLIKSSNLIDNLIFLNKLIPGVLDLENSSLDARRSGFYHSDLNGQLSMHLDDFYIRIFL